MTWFNGSSTEFAKQILIRLQEDNIYAKKIILPGDSVLLSMENMNLHVPSLQFGGNFHFNVILKNPNNSEWNCELQSYQTRRYYDSIFLWLKTIQNNPTAGTWCHSCFISLNRFPCAMLGDNCPSKILVGWAGSK